MTKECCRLVYIVSCIAFMLGSVAGLAAEPQELQAGIGPVQSFGVVVRPHYGDLYINVWPDRQTYWIGDRIRINFNVNRDCYVYIFNTDAGGTTRQIFPNYYDHDNFVRGGRTYYIPDSGYELQVTGPPGQEYIHAVAVSARYSFLDSYHDLRRSAPFPIQPHGAEGLMRKLNEQRNGAQKRGETGLAEPQNYRGQELRLVIPPPPPPPPLPPPYPRYSYAESYTSFYVYGRDWDRTPRPYYYGKVKITSSPSHAQVYIDGKYHGRTPETVSLSTGYHELMLENSGYYDWYQTIYIYGREKQDVHARLTSRSYPFPYPRYYFRYYPYVVPEYRFEYHYYRYPRYWWERREREEPPPRDERRDERRLQRKSDEEVPQMQRRGNLIQFDNQDTDAAKRLIEKQREQKQYRVPERLNEKERLPIKERLPRKNTSQPKIKLENKNQKEDSSRLPTKRVSPK